MSALRGRKVVAFGELLLRLNPPGYERIVQCGSFEARFTGAEANAAALLASLGHRACAVSKVPETELGQACVNYLRRFGIDTEYVVRGGSRLGLFYLESGAAQRASLVIYDRAASAFSELSAADLDWDAILSGCSWLHFSGTAPAAGGDAVISVLREGLGLARGRGIAVSCDLNYRSKLWSPQEAREVMTELVRDVDVLIGNEEDAITVFGLDSPGIDVAQGELAVESYRSVAAQLVERFGLKVVATTLRTSVSASANRWRGLLFDGERHYTSREYEISPIVDRVGGGDSFSAGLIHGLLEDLGRQETLEFATAASCLKHSIIGDFNLVSRGEIEALIAGDASGRIRR